MKKRDRKLNIFCIVVALILIVTLLTSCASVGELIGFYDLFLTEGLEPSETMSGSNSSEEQTNTSGGNNVVNNSLTINAEGGEDTVYATAAGMRSAVSIYCRFTERGYSKTKYYSTGSGVIYKLENDGSAFIITNYHVVYDSDANTSNRVSDEMYVFLYGMEAEEYAIPATYVGGSANYDIAVLYVDLSDVLRSALSSGSVAAVTVANSDELYPGTKTIAIGNPSSTDLGGLSVTKGIVSVDSEYITMDASDGSGEVSFRVIRTDTALNAGNSGGGLFNARGELIGIVNAKIVSDDIEGIGYAIPSNVARAIADNIIDYCFEKDCETVMRGLLGVTVTISEYKTEYDTETGAIRKIETVAVDSVTSGGLAEGILKQGDVIKSITIGGETTVITRQHHLIDAMLDVRVGDKVSIDIISDGKEVTVSALITRSCLVAY